MPILGCVAFIPALLVVLQCIVVVLGELRTIDDTYGDSVTGATPTYLDTNCWNKGPGCSVCVAQPDPSQAHNGTWHDTQSSTCNNVFINSPTVHTVSFAFTGPEIKITNLTFDLDGETSASLFNPSISGTNYEYQYNVPVYSRTFLNNTQHSFVIYEDDENDAKPSSESSALNISWSTHLPGLGSSTAPSISSSTSTVKTSSNTHSATSSSGDASGGGSSSTDAIVSTASATGSGNNLISTHRGTSAGVIGGVLGAIAFIVLCFGLAIYSRRRRRTQNVQEMNQTAITPFVSLQDPKPKQPGAPTLLPTPVTNTLFPTTMPDSVTPPIMTDSRSNYDGLVREIQGLKTQLKTLRADRPNVDVVLAPSAGNLRRSTATLSRPMEAGVEEELRTEIATLRAEVARLQAETEDRHRDVPPAYYW
ncbi:uncharacterized protein B0H18DRAFT_952965 [Fomitopsis serialis]|uniref:uncharacterized protein n=1 Tax=Fomitopsis serialis TaxID=139415 RepID=UPI0020077590|nr:uncharacterized protein B0H18DRAFT_952965 [Neoantrodia serialis]KAH9930963.1 hypothetical protein B0H18DRAFT_952965 [Neoantrodia serialis]